MPGVMPRRLWLLNEHQPGSIKSLFHGGILCKQSRSSILKFQIIWMKFKFLILNIALVFFIAGLFSAVIYGFKPVFSLTVLASSTIIVLYAYQLIEAFIKGKFWTLENLLIFLLNLIIAVIFIHGLSLSIDRYLLNDYPVFKVTYSIAGNLLIILFLVVSIIWIDNSYQGKKRKIFIAVHILIAVPLFIGINGFTGDLPIHEKWLGIGVLLHIVLLLGNNIYKGIISRGKLGSDILIVLVCSFLLVTLSIFKYFFNEAYGFNIYKTIILVAFITLFVLPLAILGIRRFQIFHILLLFLALLDLYAIHTMGSNYYYFVYYGAHRMSAIPIDTILKEPSSVELDLIRKEWQAMDFTPKDVHLELEKINEKGDTIKVVSHIVEGSRHYGILRIPKGLNVDRAPILVVLGGGSTHINFQNENFLFEVGGEKSKTLLDNFLTIAPINRGNILKVNNRIFFAGGRERDAFIGAAVDAVSFLEVVRAMYAKDENTKILGFGSSKGATIALMIGGLTNNFDKIIAVSAFTNFLNQKMVKENRIGGPYEKGLNAPGLPFEIFRKRIITCSPYYFAENLPPFNLHHGTDDPKIDIWHANILEEKLRVYGVLDSLHQIHVYDGKGHTYFDRGKVYEEMKQFLELKKTEY